MKVFYGSKPGTPFFRPYLLKDFRLFIRIQIPLAKFRMKTMPKAVAVTVDGVNFHSIRQVRDQSHIGLKTVLLVITDQGL